MPSVSPILDGELLTAFVAFSDTLNFTHAARQVGLSQPALFERIKKLTDRMQTPLYERQGRQLRLTAAGVRVAAFGRDMLEQSTAFVRSLSGTTTEAVTLAAGEGSFLYVLGDALRRFGAEPGHTLSVLERGGPSAVDAVRSGEAHLGVGVFDLIPRGLRARDILRTPLCAAMPARHALARHKVIRLRQLAAHRLILAPEGRRQRELVGRAIADLGPGLAEPIEADGWALMLSFVAARLGLAVVNGVCRPPRGVVLRPIPELGTVTYRLLERPGRRPSPAVDRLAALILDSCAAMGAP